MAYPSHYRSASQGSGCGVTAIDGVAIKLNEKLIPPAKVTLPLDYEPGNPSEVLFLEYDFSLEEKILEWTESQRETEQAMNKAETERVGDSIEMFSRPTGTDQSADPVASTDEDEGTESTWNRQNGSGTQQPSVAPKPTPFMNLGSDILTPVPIATGVKVEDNATTNGKTGVIDLRDFENEQDPFENMELKVLNDREELNKMIFGAQPSTAGPPESESGPALAGDITESIHTQPEGGSVRPASIQTTGQPPPGAPVNIKDVAYPDLDSYDSGQFADQSNSKQQSVPCSLYQHNQAFSSVNSHQVYQTVPKTTSSSSYNVQTNVKETGGLFGRVALPPLPNSNYLIQQKNTGLPASPSKTVNSGQIKESLTFTPLSVSYAKRSSEKVYMPVGGPYSRHSLQAVPNGIVVSSAEEGLAYSSGRETPPLNPLRSVRSTPDISSSEDQRLPAALPSSHTPPPGGDLFSGYKQSGSPPPRPSSQQVELEPQTQDADWNHYRILPSTPGSSQNENSPRSTSSKPGSNNSTRKTSSKLPDPYSSLKPEDQRFVENIADMGFSRARVARAVEKHGQDDKQVVDYLCLVSRVADKGYDVDEAETAIHLCENKEEKAIQYLTLLARFKEIGFSEENIQPALLSSDLDENKALDLLTSS